MPQGASLSDPGIPTCANLRISRGFALHAAGRDALRHDSWQGKGVGSRRLIEVAVFISAWLGGKSIRLGLLNNPRCAVNQGIATPQAAWT